jgi:hypothetical protein
MRCPRSSYSVLMRINGDVTLRRSSLVSSVYIHSGKSMHSKETRPYSHSMHAMMLNRVEVSIPYHVKGHSVVHSSACVL